MGASALPVPKLVKESSTRSIKLMPPRCWQGHQGSSWTWKLIGYHHDMFFLLALACLSSCTRVSRASVPNFPTFSAFLISILNVAQLAMKMESRLNSLRRTRAQNLRSKKKIPWQHSNACDDSGLPELTFPEHISFVLGSHYKGAVVPFSIAIHAALVEHHADWLHLPGACHSMEI